MSAPSCSDVCEIIHDQLLGLGFKVSDDEDHTEMIDSLSECTLIKTEELKRLTQIAEFHHLM